MGHMGAGHGVGSATGSRPRGDALPAACCCAGAAAGRWRCCGLGVGKTAAEEGGMSVIEQCRMVVAILLLPFFAAFLVYTFTVFLPNKQP